MEFLKEYWWVLVVGAVAIAMIVTSAVFMVKYNKLKNQAPKEEQKAEKGRKAALAHQAAWG